MKRNTMWRAVLLVLATTSVSVHAQPTVSYFTPVTSMVAGSPTASSLAYPQSVFVDSQNGNIWVTDFDNNRVLRFDVSSLTGIAESRAPATVERYTLGQNYPNPFNPATTIEFVLKNTEYASLTVYNVLGQVVATLFNGIANADERYTLTFNATHLPSGMYFYALRSAHRYEVRKMSCLK